MLSRIKNAQKKQRNLNHQQFLVASLNSVHVQILSERTWSSCLSVL